MVDLTDELVGEMRRALREWRRSSRPELNLGDEIDAFLQNHAGADTETIARGISKRTADVRATLTSSDRFYRVTPATGRNHRSHGWVSASGATEAVPATGTGTSDTEPAP
jgi:hypothetical protein